MGENFPAFSKIVASTFKRIIKGRNIFFVDIEGDALYEKYLAAFPEGTNPLFKERTEHDCSTCKQFIRRAGTVVAIDDNGNITTIWDDAAGAQAEYPYYEVAVTMRDLVKSAEIKDLFSVGKNEGSFGAAQTHSMDEAKNVLTWNHFHTGPIPKAFRHDSVGTVRGTLRATVQVFGRGLVELKPAAIETVLDLIASNSIYRGAEHRPALLAFQKAQTAYQALDERGKHFFVWCNAHGPASRFRNTVIGTLVQDLSEGKPLERAVGSFEAKVAPHNYKRTKALITPGMVKAAMATIKELELEPALERRFARIDDISVNDVLWVDNNVKPLMKGGLGDVLMEHATTTNASKDDEPRAEIITIDSFVQSILPEVTSMEVLFKGEHLGNLMSLTAPVHPDPKKLFRWDNDFAWSYGGGVTDSIKERVKRAGGNVTNAQLRTSLSWFNFDDLDIHAHTPNGDHISFQNKRGRYGSLDVDMNVVANGSREAVENIAWTHLVDGVYDIKVHNYTKRERIDVGFIVEVEAAGKIVNFTYNKVVDNHAYVNVAKITVKDGVVTDIKSADPSIILSGAISQERWGLHTEKYVKVDAVTLSPNYWGENAVGNKHTFFVLDGAQNDEPTRGIYNEFLASRLETHRKVFEIIGEKTKCQPTEGQLSGLGFSSTKKDSVIVKVYQGKKQRLFNVQIGQ